MKYHYVNRKGVKVLYSDSGTSRLPRNCEFSDSRNSR